MMAEQTDAHHRLILTNRGSEHTHVWWPSCSCGWIGVQRRRRKEAQDQYRAHKNGLEKAARRRKHDLTMPRRPTDRADLPEDLR